MTRDLTSKLRKNVQNSKSLEDVADGRPQNVGEGTIAKLKQHVDEIANKIDKLTELDETIKDIQLNLLFDYESNDNIKQQHNDLTNEFERLSKEVRQNLSVFQDQIESFQSRNETQTVAYKICVIQFNRLKQKLLNVIEIYHEEQCRYRDKCREHLQRQLRVLNRDVSNEEIETLVDKPERQQMFVQNYQQQSQLARQELNQFRDQSAELRKLEANIRVIHELFLDMKDYIFLQGDLIDQIEANVNNAWERAELGAKQAQQAAELKVRSCKCRVIVYALLACLVVFTILAVYFSF